MKEKIRKERLSIYLVRQQKKDEEDDSLINYDETLKKVSFQAHAIESATLYVKNPFPHSPAWARMFAEIPNFPMDIFGSTSSVGAVCILRCEGNTFILSFGTGYHLLKQDLIERDFGLRVTLNSVDPDKLRSLDKASYVDNPLNSRTQSTREVDIFELHVDSEMEMLYAVTGASKIPQFGSHVTGRDALTLMVEVNFDTISKILITAYQQYKSSLPPQFSWVDNISRVRDLETMEILDLELIDNLQKGMIDNIWLGEPEIVDWEGQIGYSFDLYSKTLRHVVLDIKDYFEYLKAKEKPLDINALLYGQVHVNNTEFHPIKSWSIYRCLYAEIEIGKEQYVLRNGTWYRVNTDFVKEVDQYLSNLKSPLYTLPTYNHDDEGSYNKAVTSDPSFILMDKNNIKIGNVYDKIEFCDLIKDKFDLIHVKYYRSSSTLSHLFSQGAVAAETFISDENFRQRLNEKFPDEIKLLDYKDRPDPGNYKIIYAIATKKSLPDELPFFSKVSLKNALKLLRTLNFTVELAQVEIAPDLLVRKHCKPNK
ncbi:TIGR04141 family sporadically distributed protein [Methylobacillus gramineus]|uniref:TIGR04141 family sporadically distributed protein n=1 Tax=Methylobacillus gramineus TaxID=755169 RepID=UPI001CFFC4CD|nr:TIGR04141 family sporadically distributed protein [Methylobacillus gramineus]MCB5185149.1 TIGR04141 family sporadically distributed protein [Methylobacillus gramineus]